MTWHLSFLRVGRRALIFAGRSIKFLALMVVAAYALTALAILVLQYYLLPRVDQYRPQIEQAATKAIGGNPVKIDRIDANWRGLRPELTLHQVQIFDPLQRSALTLPKVQAVLDWKSIPLFEPRFFSLLLQDADLTIRRDAKGRFSIAGLEIPESDPSAKRQDSPALDWLLSQNEIAIRNAKIRWIDELRKADELELRNLDFVLRNQGRDHRIALHAIGPQAIVPRIDLRAQLRHKFLSKVSERGSWSGQLFFDLPFVDLASLRTYIDYPVDVTRGQGTVRMWASIDKGLITDATADVALQNVLGRTSKTAPVVGIAQTRGRVVLADLDKGVRVRAEHMQVRLADGLELAPKALEHHVTRGENGKPDVTEVVADGVDLQSVAALLERLMPTATLRTVIAQSKASGKLERFKLRLVGDPAAPQSYEVNSKFSGLSLAAGAVDNIAHVQHNLQAASSASGVQIKPAVTAHSTAASAVQSPGFSNIGGTIVANERGGTLALDVTSGSVTLPGIFDESTIKLDQAKGELAWTVDPNKPRETLALNISNLEFANPDVQGNLHGTYIAKPGTPGMVDFKGGLARTEPSAVYRYFPNVIPQSTRMWLKYALSEGKASNTQFVLKGNLYDFPFEKNNGEFRVSAKVQGVRLDYVPKIDGKDRVGPSDWPVLTDINGEFVMDRSVITVKATDARIYGAKLSDVKVVMPNLSKSAELQIEGKGQGDLADFVRFINTSPLRTILSELTVSTQAKGQSRLALNMNIPIDNAQNTKVKGSLEFLGNDLQIDSTWPALTRTQGKLEFSETGFALRNINAQAFGGSLKVDGAPQAGVAVYRIEGAAQGSQIGRWLGFTPNAANQYFNGQTTYKAAYTLTKRQGSLQIETNLTGLGLEFPAPLRKAATETIPLRIDYMRPATPPNGTARDQKDSLAIQYGRGINIRLEREGDPTLLADGKPLMRYVRGGVGVNESMVVPDSGIIVNVNMPVVDFDAWGAVADGIATQRVEAVTPQRTDRPNIAAINTSTTQPARPTAPATATANSPAATNNTSGLPLPEVVAARAKVVIVGGKRLNDVVLGASRADRTWQVNLDAQEVSGYATWRMGTQGGLGAVEAKFAKLIIPKDSAKEVSALLEGQSSQRMPQLDVVAEQFSLFGRDFGALELRARNVWAANEWRIEKLSLTNRDAVFDATGSWGQATAATATRRRMNIKFNLDITNAGQLMNRMGFNDLMRNGTGKMEGTLSWNGQPYSIDYPTLGGRIGISMDKGQILKADAGAAKLLGVLTLQSLPRRLSLDFRDVFSEGFAYDTIRGNIDMGQGIATTQDLKLKGINATVVVGGKSNLVKEEIDFRFVVVPEVNMGTGSLLALATNPAIGIGTFVAQLIFREPLMKAFTFEYAATGKWSDPKFEKVQSGNNRADKAPDGASATTSGQ